VEKVLEIPSNVLDFVDTVLYIKDMKQATTRESEMYATIVIDRDGTERLLGHESNVREYNMKRMRGWANAGPETDVRVEVRKTTKARGTEVIESRLVKNIYR
jgi:hypothetical protein